VIAAGVELARELRTLQDHAGRGLVLRQVDRRVEQRLVGNDARSSMPQLADRMTWAWQSSMRVASSFGAKPPNTTECTAPMRAQASMRPRLRHHRHVEDDAVALLDAE
jgi:hypothetical protein